MPQNVFSVQPEEIWNIISAKRERVREGVISFATPSL
jgi:hypothetical protein